MPVTLVEIQAINFNPVTKDDTVVVALLDNVYLITVSDAVEFCRAVRTLAP